MRPSFRPVRTVAPTAKPVTLEEAKAHLHVDFDDDDALIGGVLDAAIEHLDGYSGILGRCLCLQTWRQDYDGIGHCLRLPMLAASLTTATYISTDGSTVTISGAALYDDALGSFVDVFRNQSLPALADVVAPVSVTAVYGYGAASDVPAPIKAAILLMVGDMYLNRETTEVPMNNTVMALLSPYRRVSL